MPKATTTPTAVTGITGPAAITAATTATATTPTAATSVLRPTGTISAVTAGTAATTAAAATSVLRPTGTISAVTAGTPTTTTPTTSTIPTTPPASTTAPIVPKTGSILTSGPLIRTGAKPDLVLTTQDVHLSSLNPRVGDTITAAINVRNTSAIDVTAAKVIWTLMADGKQAGQGEIPISVKANSSAQVQWRGVVPNVNTLVLTLNAVNAVDANPSNNTAIVNISVVR